MGDLQVINMPGDGALFRFDDLVRHAKVICVDCESPLGKFAREVFPEEHRCLNGPVQRLAQSHV